MLRVASDESAGEGEVAKFGGDLAKLGWVGGYMYVSTPIGTM